MYLENIWNHDHLSTDAQLCLTFDHDGRGGTWELGSDWINQKYTRVGFASFTKAGIMIQVYYAVLLLCLLANAHALKHSASDFRKVADQTGPMDLSKVPFSKKSRLGKLHTDRILLSAENNSPDSTFSVSSIICFYHLKLNAFSPWNLPWQALEPCSWISIGEF